MRALTLGVWVLFTIALVVVSVAIISQNTEDITLSLFHLTTEPHPKWVMIGAASLAGALIASLFFIFELIVLQTRNVRLRRINRKLEKALGLQQTKIQNKNPVSASSVREPLLDDEDV